MSAKFEESKRYPLPCSIITDTLGNPGLFESEKFRFVGAQPCPGGTVYRYRHGMSMFSHGEDIKITVKPTATGDTEVSVYSECAMPTQIMDWGQNKNNVTNVFKRLKQYVATATPPPQPKSSTKCPFCGQALPSGSRYCAFCGGTF